MTPPVVARTRNELVAARAALPGRVGVVMTMGALHAGHVRLIDVAKEQADSVVVTIFVNPLQFGAGEDLDRYPRTFDADLAICADHGADVVFAPTVDEMYPPGEDTATVSAGELGRRLEGAVRPTHFDGMLTVVARLMRLVRPDLAVFGEKDAQQLALIRRMVVDQAIPVEVLGVEIVREADGLAMSSRNRYLDESGRRSALVLSRSLRAGAGQTASGLDAVRDAVMATLAEQPDVKIDYVTVVDDETWQDAGASTRDARILVAGRVGSTRLIDNIAVSFGKE